jgi:hypothetical protein
VENEKMSTERNANLEKIRDMQQDKQKVLIDFDGIDDKIKEFDEFDLQKTDKLDGLIGHKQSYECTAVLLQDRIENLEKEKKPLERRKEELEGQLETAYHEIIETIESNQALKERDLKQKHSKSFLTTQFQTHDEEIGKCNVVLDFYQKQLGKILENADNYLHFSKSFQRLTEKLMIKAEQEGFAKPGELSPQNKPHKENFLAEFDENRNPHTYSHKIGEQNKIIRQKDLIASKIKEYHSRNTKLEKSNKPHPPSPPH